MLDDLMVYMALNVVLSLSSRANGSEHTVLTIITSQAKNFLFTVLECAKDGMVECYLNRPQMVFM